MDTIIIIIIVKTYGPPLPIGRVGIDNTLLLHQRTPLDLRHAIRRAVGVDWGRVVEVGRVQPPPPPLMMMSASSLHPPPHRLLLTTPPLMMETAAVVDVVRTGAKATVRTRPRRRRQA